MGFEQLASIVRRSHPSLLRSTEVFAFFLRSPAVSKVFVSVTLGLDRDSVVGEYEIILTRRNMRCVSMPFLFYFNLL